MVFKWSQILAVAYLASTVFCGTLQSSKESIRVTSKGNGRIDEEKMDLCPPENSELPVILAHPDDCSKFYVCDNGTPHLKYCQPGLHFNPILNACDYPKNVGCNKKVTSKGNGRIDEEKMDFCPPENSELPVHLAHPDDCSKFYVCDNGTPHLKSCQPGLHFNPILNACDYPKNAGCNKRITSKENGVIDEEKSDFCSPDDSELPVHLAHPDDCSKFYVCDNGKPHLKSCQPGLHFNPTVNFCDYPKNAGCDKKHGMKEKGKIVERVFDTCPPENSEDPVYIPHNSDCDKFYVCDNGVANLQSCQLGLHFNPKLNACDYPQNAGCEKSVVAKGRDNVLEKESGPCPPENSNDPLYLSHPKDCNKFYVCDNGKPRVESCPVGLHFNQEVKTCDYPENAGCEKILEGVVMRSAEKKLDDSLDSCPFETDGHPLFIPHPTDCGQFFICKEGKQFPLSCPTGLHFNSQRGVCDFPENTECGKRKIMRAGVSSPFCPPMDGQSPVFFRHSKNCNVFYMCGNGLAYEFSCPARLHFNLRKKVCDYEVNAKCKVVGS